MKGFRFHTTKAGMFGGSLLVSCALFFAVPCLCQSQTPAPTPDTAQPDTPETLYKEAQNLFQAGDAKAAAEKLEKVITLSGKDAQLEAVYYTLGAAYFNLQDYSKAAAAFQKLVDLYPQAARLNDAIFSIGQAAYFGKDYEKAVNAFQRLESVPAFRERALLNEGLSLKEQGKTDKAKEILERLVSAGISSEVGVNGAIVLASIYSSNKDSDNARKLIQTVQSKLDLLDNIMQLNAVLIKLGDDLLAQSKPEDALFCFRLARSNKDVVEFQSRRIAAVQKKITDNIDILRKNPTRVVELVQTNNELRTTLASNQSMLEEFKKLPEFRPTLLLRLAACYSAMGRKWEAAAAYEEFLERYPQDPARETGLYGIITVFAELNRIAKIRTYGDQYIAEFSDNPNESSVVYLIGATAMQASEWQMANEYFGKTLAPQKSNKYNEEMLFLLGNVHFMQAQYDAAAIEYKRYLKDFEKGQHREEAVYRMALCAFFSGSYANALKQLEDYLQKYPSGEFRSDALYRKGVCLFAAQQYDSVLAACQAWKQQYGKAQQLGEVLALEGDALAAKDSPNAIDAYLQSYQQTSSDEVIHYSLFAAQKLLQKQGKWDEIGRIFEDFVQSYPSHPDFLTAIYWIGKSKAHEGKLDEAKQFLAGTIKKSINDPDKEAVEQLISQLAQLCAKKKSRIQAEPQPADATPSPTPEATDPQADLDRLLGNADNTPTAKARILYAKSEICRMRRQAEESQNYIKQIANEYKPEDLSPMLLAVAGDYLLEQNETEKAVPLFQRIKDDYPRCDMLDYAYNGLGEAAYRREDYKLALQLFTDAIDKIGASTKLLDVTLGKAKTLKALGRLDEAKKEFEDIASRREWRGEATAQSLFSLGAIAEQRNNLPEAIAFYQRVFVAYKRYLPWVAKAYLQSAGCFERIGKSQEALNTYREMLRNQKLAAFSEAKTAALRIETLQAGGAK